MALCLQKYLTPRAVRSVSCSDGGWTMLMPWNFSTHSQRWAMMIILSGSDLLSAWYFRPIKNSAQIIINPLFFKRKIMISDWLLTLIEVVWLSDVNENQSHQLELRQSLTSWTRQWKQVAKVCNFRIDEVATHFRSTFGTFTSSSAAAATATTVATTVTSISICIGTSSIAIKAEKSRRPELRKMLMSS